MLAMAARCASIRRDLTRGSGTAEKLSASDPATTIEEKAPLLTDRGFRISGGGCAARVHGSRHMWSIMTCPKPEHDTCVAPSISRAKS